MNKKQLKQRLCDICAGAGMPWDDDHEFFSFEYDYNECFIRSIDAICLMFNLDNGNEYLLLRSFNDMDSLLNQVQFLIEEKEE